MVQAEDFHWRGIGNDCLQNGITASNNTHNFNVTADAFSKQHRDDRLVLEDTLFKLKAKQTCRLIFVKAFPSLS